MAPIYDIIVYGASGFTGRLCVRYLVSCSSAASTKIAAAGRSEGKIKDVLKEIGAEQVPVVIADSKDEAALTEMVKKTKVVVTTVGPYALYGSTLAKVCSQNGVHCVDLTGEPLWSREMLELYNEDAKRTKAILIHGSGFDSVPSDLNTLLAVKKLQSVTDVPVGDVVSFVSAKGEASGGTIATMLNQMDVIQDPVKNKQMQDPYLLSPIKGPQKVALALSYYHGNEVGTNWIMEPTNAAVVRQTWGLLEEQAKKDPSALHYGPHFTYREHMASKSWFGAALVSLTLLASATVLGASKMIRGLAARYLPAAGSGPSESSMTSGWFTLKTTAKTHDNSAAVQSIMKGKGDPGYLGTSVMLCESALGLAHDYDRLTPMAKEGGHLTSVTVFGDKVLKERLEATGRFEFESSTL